MKKSLLKLAALAMVTMSLFSMTHMAFAAEDVEMPSDVENLVASPLNASVKLTWDAATDNVKVTGYKVYYGQTSVSEPGQEYEKNEDAKDVLTYTVRELENGKKYYFSVIAYDAAGNESENWAIEASATPSADAGDTDDSEAPEVTEATALNKVEVKVEFSEAVVLPEEEPETAFTVENSDTMEELDVTGAKMDEDDETNKTVILTTAAQTKDVTYKLTVGIDVEDEAGNPIVSGTSDTAIFSGSDAEKTEEDAGAPEVTGVEVIDNTHVMVNFNKTVVLSIDPSTNFKITEQGGTKELEVLGVEMGSNDDGVEDASAIVTTSAQEEKTYLLTVTDVKDEADNEINPEKDSDTFEGTLTEEDDTAGDENAPKDVAKFLADVVLEGDKYMVDLSWEVTDKENVKEQVIYRSEDKGKKYEEEATLESDVEEYQVKDNLTEGEEYWFKITQKDEAGNESAGKVVKVVISETGPEVVGIVLLSAVLGRLVTKKKK